MSIDKKQTQNKVFIIYRSSGFLSLFSFQFLPHYFKTLIKCTEPQSNNNI